MDTPSPQPTSRWQRRLLHMAPSLLVLVGILAYNWFVYWRPLPVVPPSPTNTAVSPAAAQTPLPTQAAAASQPESLAAPATAIIPTATATPQPTLPPTAQITLLGPPDSTTIRRSDTITLYWQWPLPLTDMQHFVVYLTQPGSDQPAETAVATLTEPNLGSGYRVTIPADAWAASGTAVSWRIQLEDTTSGLALRASETRSLTLLPGQ